jgi:myb proto-oncogene protein
VGPQPCPFHTNKGHRPQATGHRPPPNYTLNHPSFLELLLSTSCMEFDNNLREDFPFLSCFFSDNLSKPELTTNGFSLEASSSKELVHDFQHFDGFNNLNPDHHHVDHFNVEGYSSSDPLYGIQAPWVSEGFLKDFNAYASTLFASDGNNGNMHGFESSQNNLVQPMAGQSQIYLPLNVKELGSANVRVADDVSISCITLDNGYHRRAYQKKRKRVHIRKASKVQKKHNIIKGQWTPQEDRYVYIELHIILLCFG